MVEVFKTNVQQARQADSLVARLSKRFADFRILFDLEDCDNILRIEGPAIPSESIIAELQSLGFHCEILP